MVWGLIAGVAGAALAAFFAANVASDLIEELNDWIDVTVSWLFDKINQSLEYVFRMVVVVVKKFGTIYRGIKLFTRSKFGTPTVKIHEEVVEYENAPDEIKEMADETGVVLVDSPRSSE
jgi:hypothetical protein